LIALFEPLQCMRFIAKSHIHLCDEHRGRIA
jgi:hypothetical protein